MVKGTSRQVIVVHSPGEELFDQAIFILKDKAVGQGITDEKLLKEAKAVIHGANREDETPWMYGPLWACGGAAVTAVLWLITSLL